MADIDKTGLEELANDNVQPGAGAETNVAGGQQGAGESQSSKGAWINMLPADLRAGVEVEKYAGFAEYIKDLRARAEGKDAHDEKAFTEGWDGYMREMRESGMDLPESITSAMREAKVPAESAKRIYKAISEYGSEQEKKASEGIKMEMARYMKEIWGDAFEANNALVISGLRLFGKDHPALIQKANARGAVYFPEFTQLLVDYAKARGEQRAPEGTPSKPADPDNPFGLKNI